MNRTFYLSASLSLSPSVYQPMILMQVSRSFSMFRKQRCGTDSAISQGWKEMIILKHLKLKLSKPIQFVQEVETLNIIGQFSHNFSTVISRLKLPLPYRFHPKICPLNPHGPILQKDGISTVHKVAETFFRIFCLFWIIRKLPIAIVDSIELVEALQHGDPEMRSDPYVVTTTEVDVVLRCHSGQVQQLEKD